MRPRCVGPRISARLVVACLLASCASPGVPPGGPEDLDPPALVRVRPDTGAVNVRADAVGFDFDDVVSERPQGATALADLFLISPSRGPTSLSWRRTRLEVRPRGGFRPNTTYRVTLLPGLVDLDGNVDSVGHSLVFSTGPSIASGVITGRVFDWMAERPAGQALVEALVLPDSLRYLAVADSLGRFELRNLPEGPYVLRALVDQNKNRFADPRELYDTITVALRDSTDRVLHALVRDTLGPNIQQVELVDSLTLRVRFDHPLDTALAIDLSRFSLRNAADSTPVTLARALGAREVRRLTEDSIRTKARQDSIRAANDTTAADSAAARPAPRPAPPAPRAAPRPGTPARDTTPPPRPTVKLPEQEVVITLPRPLPPTTNFIFRAEGMRTVLGRTRTSERRFTTPRPPRRTAADSARRDSAAVRRDTGTVRRDTGTVRRDTVDRRR